MNFVMITRPADRSPLRGGMFAAIEEDAVDQAREAFPEVRWLAEYALGPEDRMSVFSAPDLESAGRVAAMMEGFEDMETEVWLTH